MDTTQSDEVLPERHEGDCAKCLNLARRQGEAANAEAAARSELHYIEIRKRQHMRHEAPWETVK
jgi:hypothetical protein